MNHRGTGLAIGYGTTSTSYKLDVNGTGNFAGNLTAANLVAATWAPTITNVSGVSTVTVRSGTYQRVGNIVSFTFRAQLTCNGAANPVVYGFSLPVASNFSATYDLSALVGCTSNTGTYQGQSYADADTTNKRGQCTISVSAASNGISYEHIITGQYVIK